MAPPPLGLDNTVDLTCSRKQILCLGTKPKKNSKVDLNKLIMGNEAAEHRAKLTHKTPWRKVPVFGTTQFCVVKFLLLT
ncbi:uncharacterized protein G2W53_034718 [Senna tora]|uniref:Uncharacterized protein n=2 Tax=Senna tora TaxID=362788 RepID=A0A834W956_9FABA|nr:uncharacterized protein G2W53_034718 [Senna tora]